MKRIFTIALLLNLNLYTMEPTKNKPCSSTGQSYYDNLSQCSDAEKQEIYNRMLRARIRALKREIEEQKRIDQCETDCFNNLMFLSKLIASITALFDYFFS